jgi:hypothetical protein
MGKRGKQTYEKHHTQNYREKPHDTLVARLRAPNQREYQRQDKKKLNQYISKLNPCTPITGIKK